LTESCHDFNAFEDTFGFPFMPLAEFCDPDQGFLVSDACNIGAEV